MKCINKRKAKHVDVLTMWTLPNRVGQRLKIFFPLDLNRVASYSLKKLKIRVPNSARYSLTFLRLVAQS